MRLQSARSIMAALAAFGMIFTTTAHAASLDGVASRAYRGQPAPSVWRPMPSSSVPAPLVRNDIKVTLTKVTRRQDVVYYTYRLENSGPGTAHDVGLTRSSFRSDNPGASEYESISERVGDVAPGARQTIAFSCAPKTGHPPCHSSSVSVYFGPGGAFGSDVDLSNNQATGWAASAVES